MSCPLCLDIGDNLVNDPTNFTDAALTLSLDDFCLEECLSLVNFPVIHLHGYTITTSHIGVTRKDATSAIRTEVLIVMKTVGTPCIFARGIVEYGIG